MKPVHVALLVLGAALAGGLAVKITQPPPIPVSVARPARPPVSVAPTAASEPPAVATPKKPSPLPAPVASSPAPPAVYTGPARRPEALPRPAIVHPPVDIPRRREEFAQAKPLDVPPLPVETPAPAAPPAAKVAEAPPAPVPTAPLAKVIVPPPAPALPPALHQVTLRPGMTILVRIDEALSTERNTAGNTFTASLAEPIVIDGLVIAERGARIAGRILDSQKAGRIGGVSMLELALSSLVTSDGQHVSIATDPWTKRGDTSHGADAAKIGGGAALGAVVGAIAGGGTGAAIGAGIGGVAGAGTVMATRGKPVEIPSETVVAFRVSYAVTISERRAI